MIVTCVHYKRKNNLTGVVEFGKAEIEGFGTHEELKELVVLSSVKPIDGQFMLTYKEV